MRALIFTLFSIFAASLVASAQIQKGNVMVGGDIMQLNLSLNEGKNFTLTIDPKAAWFIQDNIALGAYMHFNLITAKGAGSSISYGIGPLARFYINEQNITVLRHTRFFIEANIGIEGTNPRVGSSTNGLGLGFGPGIAYFITPNVALEGLFKFQGIIGFGSSVTSSNLVLGIGFQVFLPGSHVEKAIKGKQ